MSGTEEQVQEGAPPTFNVFRRLSRPIGRSPSSYSIASDRAIAVRDVEGPVKSCPTFSESSKPTAFNRLKSQLGKMGRSSKQKETVVGLTLPHAAEIGNIPREIESKPQSTETTGDICVGPSQNTASGSSGERSRNNPSCDSGEEAAAGNNNSNWKDSVEQETSNHNFNDISQTMSTTALARIIHSLLSPFPSSYKLIPSGSFLFHGHSDESGAESVKADSTFLSLLSSPSAMNGSVSKGRESVWSALERLRPHPHPKEEPRENGENNEHEAETNDVDMSSVMICCPLQPTEDTEVEIARSEVVSVNYPEPSHEPGPAEQPNKQGVWKIPWDFGKGKGKNKSEILLSSEKALPPPPPTIKEVRVWYPSRTKISLQAFWWGYRIYLPPPVMRVLNDKSLEAAKRAAIITAALTWLVSHLPTTMLPPQIRSVVTVVKQIVPIMSYVGGFIAWSWNTIQGFDKGQGVTLSATWLLPIALIPGTWFYIDELGSPSIGESSGT